LNGREHAPGGVVEIGAQRVATAGNLLQEARHGCHVRTEHAKQIRVSSLCFGEVTS